MPKEKENGDAECPPAFKKFNPWIKIIGSVLGLVLLVGGVIWGSINTFAMKPEVAAVEQKIVEAKIEANEHIELASSSLLQTIQQDRKNSDIRFYQQQTNQSVDAERKIRNELQKNPNDQFLNNQLQEELRKQQQYREILDKLLRAS